MNTLQFIRKNVFHMTQQQLAVALATNQPTICRWEKRGSCTFDAMQAIRRLARDRGVDWSDSWFFEIPETDDA